MRRMRALGPSGKGSFMPCASASRARARWVGTRAGARSEVDLGEKAAITAERYAGVERVCAVAKRHELRHTQLFTWRREMRRAAAAAGVTLPVAIVPEPLFLPAVIEPARAAVPAPRKKRLRRTRPEVAAIELLTRAFEMLRLRRPANARSNTISARCVTHVAEGDKCDLWCDASSR